MNGQTFIFAVDDFRYGLPMDRVQEVIQIRELLPSPLAIPGFEGFLTLRDQLLPVFDLHERAGGAASTEKVQPCMVIVEEGVTYALRMDRYLESVVLPENPEALPSTPPTARSYVERVVGHRGHALHLLNLRPLCETIRRDLKSVRPVAPLPGQGTSGPAEPDLDLICFRIGEQTLAIPITHLVEIIEGFNVEPLFRTASCLRGLINLRGQIIACVDVSEAMGLPLRRMEERNQYMVLQYDGRDLALCIDAISKKTRFARTRLQAVESMVPSEFSALLSGVVEESDRRVFILSTEKLFAHPQLAEYRE